MKKCPICGFEAHSWRKAAEISNLKVHMKRQHPDVEVVNERSA
jgi:hypothetical protein